ncbi:MAG: hypothetical protein HC764_12255 [Pleurocapsa sp. CRU_1_2]|nr:hypothetical protein [Pleurocapsa sp. CRU_1_2]
MNSDFGYTSPVGLMNVGFNRANIKFNGGSILPGSSSILKQEKDIVANASKNLEQILQISKTAQRHLFSVAHTANTQIKTALTVSNLKSELNQTSQSIYALSDRTVNSLEKTALTAKDLKNVLDFLKLDRA